MAYPGRVVSGGSLSGAADAVLWREHPLARPRRGAGHLGVSTTGNSRIGYHQRIPAQPARRAEELLARLIDRLVEDPTTLSVQLIDHYGSIAAVIAAFADGKHPSAVVVPPWVAEYFGIIADTLCRSTDAEAVASPQITSPDALSAMLKRDMLELEIEVFRVIFLDGNNATLSDQVMWTGTVNSVQAHPREIIKQAILLGATAVILAHNHPSASAYPSATDLVITRNIVVACAAIDVEVHDHMIVARDGAFSMRSAGILKGMKEGSLVC